MAVYGRKGGWAPKTKILGSDLKPSAISSVTNPAKVLASSGKSTFSFCKMGITIGISYPAWLSWIANNSVRRTFYKPQIPGHRQMLLFRITFYHYVQSLTSCSYMSKFLPRQSGCLTLHMFAEWSRAGKVKTGGVSFVVFVCLFYLMGRWRALSLHLLHVQVLILYFDTSRSHTNAADLIAFFTQYLSFSFLSWVWLSDSALRFPRLSIKNLHRK